MRVPPRGLTVAPLVTSRPSLVDRGGLLLPLAGRACLLLLPASPPQFFPEASESLQGEELPFIAAKTVPRTVSLPQRRPRVTAA